MAAPESSRIDVSSGRDGLPGKLGKSAKGLGVAHGDVGEHLAVHLDAGLVEAVDEFGIGHALLARGGVDAGDPQAAEVALAGAPVAVRVGARAHELLVREAVTRVLAAPVALGLAEDLLAPLAPGDGIGRATH